MANQGMSAINQAKRTNGGLQAILLDRRTALTRFLLARGARTDEAEDILQDLFIKLETQAIAPVAEPLAYLYRMTANEFFDRRRSGGRRASREQAWMEVQQTVSSESDDRPSPEQTLMSRESLAIVSNALAALPDRTLLIFRRFRLDGVPQRQIAEGLGISLSAVEKHLQRAYQVVVEARKRINADIARPHRHGEE